MPVVSLAQLRAMHAADEGHSTLGIPPSVGHEFVQATHGTQHLPEHVAKSPATSLRHKLRTASRPHGKS